MKKTKTAKKKTTDAMWAARAAKIAASRAANEKKGTTVRQQRAAAKLAREKAAKKAAKKGGAKKPAKTVGDQIDSVFKGIKRDLARAEKKTKTPAKTWDRSSSKLAQREAAIGPIPMALGGPGDNIAADEHPIKH